MDEEKLKSLRTVTIAVYALQAAGFVTGGLGFLVAIVMNYVKKEEVAGTPYESHFRWQIRTFWFGLLWCVVGGITALVLIGFAILFANTVWIIYRIVKGWLNLNDGKPMPGPSAAGSAPA
jgi:uncharacterized membrane protein